jgi:hypothetical protein
MTLARVNDVLVRGFKPAEEFILSSFLVVPVSALAA